MTADNVNALADLIRSAPSTEIAARIVRCALFEAIVEGRVNDRDAVALVEPVAQQAIAAVRLEGL